MSRLRSFVLFAASVIALAGCGGVEPRIDGFTKYQVTGVVTINGEPREHVVVTFNPTKVPGAMAVGTTDAEGKYRLSTTNPGDGAVADDFVVTFQLTSTDPNITGDFMRNKYYDLAKSKFKVTVPTNDTEVPPFALEVPADWLTTPPPPLDP